MKKTCSIKEIFVFFVDIAVLSTEIVLEQMQKFLLNLTFLNFSSIHLISASNFIEILFLIFICMNYLIKCFKGQK